MICFWCKFGFGKCFGASSWSNHCAGHCWLLCKIHFSSHITNQSRNDLLLLHRIRWDFNTIFLMCGQPMRQPLIELFHLSNFPQMLNDHRMVSAEFFGNFLCSCQRISFDDCYPLVICQLLMAGHYVPHIQSSHLLCKISWSTTALYIYQQFLGLMCCWCCKLSLLLYDPF